MLELISQIPGLPAETYSLQRASDPGKMQENSPSVLRSNVSSALTSCIRRPG